MTLALYRFMVPTAAEPRLPVELERGIFEVEASLYPPSMPILVLVAQRIEVCASRFLTYLLLLVPPLVVSFYLLASFPTPPHRLPVPVLPGLASLTPESRACKIYPCYIHATSQTLQLTFRSLR
ncbi:hypothetical protein DFH07DRAFT_968324 [Mycena maculata]|uniref:Uncharacterized protein n=1 Tax=Mycena maculata TaxID=230809 RepID=A0AAD7MTU5_9AGAR|nr:hypothetical protein DFH07DRAFT_968324 [Mycena maculata]